MADNNGQGVPIVGNLPILSSACEWRWEVHPIGRDDNTGEKVFLLRLILPTGVTEVWAPAAFIRDMGERLVAAGAGLHIAGEMPPS